jgi:hypothetical protein
MGERNWGDSTNANNHNTYSNQHAHGLAPPMAQPNKNYKTIIQKTHIQITRLKIHVVLIGSMVNPGVKGLLHALNFLNPPHECFMHT